jgi:hypothetical protein
VACGAIAAAFYPLLKTYCNNPEGQSQAQILNQVCNN